jgi:hypothetical protein
MKCWGLYQLDTKLNYNIKLLPKLVSIRVKTILSFYETFSRILFDRVSNFCIPPKFWYAIRSSSSLPSCERNFFFCKNLKLIFSTFSELKNSKLFHIIHFFFTFFTFLRYFVVALQFHFKNNFRISFLFVMKEKLHRKLNCTEQLRVNTCSKGTLSCFLVLRVHLETQYLQNKLEFKYSSLVYWRNEPYMHW